MNSKPHNGTCHTTVTNTQVDGINQFVLTGMAAKCQWRHMQYQQGAEPNQPRPMCHALPVHVAVTGMAQQNAQPRTKTVPAALRKDTLSRGAGGGDLFVGAMTRQGGTERGFMVQELPTWKQGSQVQT